MRADVGMIVCRCGFASVSVSAFMSACECE